VINDYRVTKLDEQLRAMLSRIDSGHLDASATLRARIEGALVALEIVLGADADTALERLNSSS
jgi:hypothetical protein